MKFSSGFFKVTAVCAHAAGLLWVLLMFLSFAFTVPSDLESTIDMYENPVSAAVVAIGFLAMFFFIVAFWGTAARKLGESPGLASTGFIFAFAGFLLQVVGYGIMLFPWMRGVAAYLEADAAAGEIIKTTLLSSYYEIAATLTFSAAACWAVMMLLFGLATFKGISRLQRLLSTFFFMLCATVVLNLFAMATAMAWLTNLTIPLMAIFTTVTMFIVGAWLWRDKRATAPADGE